MITLGDTLAAQAFTRHPCLAALGKLAFDAALAGAGIQAERLAVSAEHLAGAAVRSGALKGTIRLIRGDNAAEAVAWHGLFTASERVEAGSAALGIVEEPDLRTGLEVIGAAAAFFPGIGTVISVGIAAALDGSDVINGCF